MTINSIIPVFTPTWKTGTLVMWLVEVGGCVDSDDNLTAIQTDGAIIKPEVGKSGAIHALVLLGKYGRIEVNNAVTILNDLPKLNRAEVSYQNLLARLCSAMPKLNVSNLPIQSVPSTTVSSARRIAAGNVTKPNPIIGIGLRRLITALKCST